MSDKCLPVCLCFLWIERYSGVLSERLPNTYIGKCYSVVFKQQQINVSL